MAATGWARSCRDVGPAWGKWVAVAALPFLYSGQGFSLQRDKNRFVLPTGFRAPLRASSAGNSVLCLAKHDRWKCLTGFGLSRVEEFEDLLEKEREVAMQTGRDYDADKRAMDLYNFHEIPFDGSGRFVLPEDLAVLSGIEGEIYFQGAGRFFTAWSPEQLYAMPEGWEAAQMSCRTLAAKESGKARKK